MRRSFLCLWMPALLSIAAATARAEDGRVLAERVAVAAGIDAWPSVATLHFTWHYLPKNLSREYTWNMTSKQVETRIPPGTTPAAGDAPAMTIPADLPADAPEAQVTAHKAFVNDSYWTLFCLHLRWDDTTKTALGEMAVPTLPDLGSRRALQIQYPQQGGYTPGDSYVLYLGADDLPVAWAWHKNGAVEPTLVVRWLDYAVVNGLHVPTRFVTADGKDFIRIEAVQATPR